MNEYKTLKFKYFDIILRHKKRKKKVRPKNSDAPYGLYNIVYELLDTGEKIARKVNYYISDKKEEWQHNHCNCSKCEIRGTGKYQVK